MPFSPARALTVADDFTLDGMIAAAERRVLYLAPAISVRVAKSLEDAWARLGAEAVTVIVDADPEVYRLGYGDFEALRTLQDAAARRGGMVNQQAGVRMGLLIADDQTLVWAPVPAMVEAGKKTARATNAIRLGLPPADVERDLGAGPDGALDRSIGLDPMERKQIEAVSANLKINPPQRFDISRQLRVFNAFFEFVDMKLVGTQLQRRTVKLPSDLMGITDKPTQQKLHAAFRLITDGDGLDDKALADDRRMIEKRHLRRIKGVGLVIKSTDKAAFRKDVEELRKAVKVFQTQMEKQIQGKMDQSRATLREALLPSVTKSPPARWTQSTFYKGTKSTREFLDQDLERAFGRAETMRHDVRLDVIFKGVTYESLQKADFIAAARRAFPELPQLFEESEVAPPTPPPSLLPMS